MISKHKGEEEIQALGHNIIKIKSVLLKKYLLTTYALKLFSYSVLIANLLHDWKCPSVC